VTTSDDELQRRLSDLREILVPQVQGVDLDATRRRGRTRRTRRVAAVGVVAALLAVAAVAGARLPALTQRGVVSPAAPGVPSAAPPNAQPPPSSTAKQPPRPLVLTDRGLIGLATFGDPMAQVVRTLQEQLGPPDEEFVNQGNPEGNIFGICPGINGQYLRRGAACGCCSPRGRATTATVAGTYSPTMPSRRHRPAAGQSRRPSAASTWARPWPTSGPPTAAT
jgi:hypothetical protein